MADRFSKKVRSKIMSSIRSKDTKIERVVFRELRKRGIYFQKHYKGALGTPDIALPRKRKAVFLDGDFWHGYRYPQWKNKLPSSYWQKKIEKNRIRDRKNFTALRRAGWDVLRVWEHEILRDTDGVVTRIARFIK